MDKNLIGAIVSFNASRAEIESPWRDLARSDLLEPVSRFDVVDGNLTEGQGPRIVVGTRLWEIAAAKADKNPQFTER